MNALAKYTLKLEIKEICFIVVKNKNIMLLSFLNDI